MNAYARLTPAQQGLVLDAMPLVDRIVQRLGYVFQHVLEDDLRQMVYEGFVEAAPLHDSTQGPFSVFAWKRGVGKANEGAMREARHTQAQIVRRAGITMDVADGPYDFFADEDDDPVTRLEGACRDGAFRMFFGATFETWRTQGEQGLVDHMTRLATFHALRGAFSTLDGDEWRLLELHYIDVRSWTEVGDALGISDRQAKRRRDDIVEKLRRELAARGVKQAPPPDS